MVDFTNLKTDTSNSRFKPARFDLLYCKTFHNLFAERYTSPSKEAGLVIYLAFLAKVANLYYMILTAFKKYWPDTVAKFTSGTQDRFI